MTAVSRYLVSHLVHRWHNLLVPTPGRVEVEHRGTGERRSVDERLWTAIVVAALRPATEAEIVAAAGSAAEVGGCSRPASWSSRAATSGPTM